MHTIGVNERTKSQFGIKDPVQPNSVEIEINAFHLKKRNKKTTSEYNW